MSSDIAPSDAHRARRAHRQSADAATASRGKACSSASPPSGSCC